MQLRIESKDVIIATIYNVGTSATSSFVVFIICSLCSL